MFIKMYMWVPFIVFLKIFVMKGVHMHDGCVIVKMTMVPAVNTVVYGFWADRKPWQHHGLLSMAGKKSPVRCGLINGKILLAQECCSPLRYPRHTAMRRKPIALQTQKAVKYIQSDAKTVSIFSVIAAWIFTSSDWNFVLRGFLVRPLEWIRACLDCRIWSIWIYPCLSMCTLKSITIFK